MAIKPANPNGPTSDTAFAPLPIATWRMSVTKAKLLPARRADWGDQIQFTLQVAEQDKPKLAKLGKPLAEGEMQSEYTTYRAGATLNGYRASGYEPTKLAKFIAALFGSEQEPRLHELIRDGWVWPGAEAETEDEINAGLQWFVGLELYVKVGHRAPDANGKVWTYAESPVAIGAIAPDPAYEAFGLGKLETMLKQGGQVPTPAQIGVAEGAAVAARYDQHGNELAVDEEDEEAALERKLAEARARKAAQNKQAVAQARTATKAATAVAEPPGDGDLESEYERVFGKDA